MKARRWILARVGGAAGLLLAWLVSKYEPPGVRVSLTNHGPGVLRDVRVYVTGRSYAVGDIRVGETRTLRVNPTSESHIEVEFTDARNESVRDTAGCYFEPGYRGDIRIDLRDGRVDGVQHQTRLSVY